MEVGKEEEDNSDMNCNKYILDLKIFVAVNILN